MTKFIEGELFIYKNDNNYEIGKVKRVVDDETYFCWYHEGETAAKTHERNMNKIKNAYVIKDETLGRGEK